MGSFLAPLYSFFGILVLAALVVKVWALVDAAVRPSQAYLAADKQSKAVWLVILGIAVLVSLLFGRGLFSIFQIAAFIAAAVYLVDVRPAVRQLRRGGGSSSTGPYGPW
ncbi:MAG: DUF2516 family protein [Streptosporangiaceae bacterium]